MRLGTFVATTSLLMLALVVPVAQADHDQPACGCDGYPCAGTITIGSGRADDPLPTFYVDDRNFLLGNGVWIYMESNGKDGLQRGGGTPWFPDDPKVCMDHSEHGPDMLLF